MLFGYLSQGIVPKESEEYKVYLKLRNIYLIVSSHKIPRNLIENLKKEIEEFYKLYENVFSRYKRAKFVLKIHNLAHYPEFIVKKGPPFEYAPKKN